MKRSKSEPELEFVIVGAGFSGLCTAIQLLARGRRSFVVLEKASAVGGTWRDNTYPGCACDVPSHLYSFSFEPNPNWSRLFAPQQEIWDYLERCVDKYGVRPHLRLGREVTRAEYDEDGAFWRVHTQSGEVYTARYLVFGVGPLSRPAYPQIDGTERFAGRAFHSARWDHDYDLAGKRVAVIGTGASAIQFVPQIQPKVEQLHLFQRTAPWVMPKPDVAIPEPVRGLFARARIAQRGLRELIYWLLELRGLGFTIAPNVLQLEEAKGRKHIAAHIHDPELRRKLTPDYRAGCKRILLANDYYPALAQPNVEVVTDPITEIRERSIVTRDGVERPVDAILYGTGFRVTDLLTPVRVLGRGGKDLNDAWRDGLEGYMGTVISGFPNFFFLLGPNTGLGHNSMIVMIESQVNFALELVRGLEARGARAADVRKGAQERFNKRLQERLSTTVWSTGCQSWYLDARGKNTTVWPGLTAEFWLRTRRVDLSAFELDPKPTRRSVVEVDTALA